MRDGASANGPRAAFSYDLVLVVGLLALNSAAPALVYRWFADARDGPALEGAYFAGFLLGQPLALITVGITIVVLLRFWRPSRGKPIAFTACAGFATLPSAVLLAWPQISFASAMFQRRDASWPVVLIEGCVFTLILFPATAIVARIVSGRFGLFRASLCAAAVALAAAAAVVSPLWLPPAVEALGHTARSWHLLPRETRQDGYASAARVEIHIGHPCGIAAGTSFGVYVLSDRAPYLFWKHDTATANPQPFFGLSKHAKPGCGIASDDGGNLFVTEPSEIVVLHDDGGDALRVVGRIAGARTNIHHPLKLALDARSHLYVLQAHEILVFVTSARGDVRPIRRIADPAGSLARCTGFAADSAGTLFLANRLSDSATRPAIEVLARGETELRPERTISGPHTRLSAGTPLTIAPHGDIVALSGGDQDAIAFDNDASGDAAPHYTDEGSFDAGDPAGIAIDEGYWLHIADRGKTRMSAFPMTGGIDRP